MKIYRQQLKFDATRHYALPGLYEILSVEPARDGYAIDMWYSVLDNDRHTAEIVVNVFGTGHSTGMHIDKNEFIGTCVMSDGLVWHVFARTVV